MQIYPAIDIKNGQCVRLSQGKFDKVTVYNNDPIKVAEEWINSGASFLHIVDLDGARRGESYNREIIKEIIERFNIPIQTGGGIRSIRDIEQMIAIGTTRVILGTAAVKNHDLVKEAVKEYGDKIAIGIDAINDCVAIEGWEKVSAFSAIDLCKKMISFGIRTIIYTDIAKDGMMIGPNIENIKQLVASTDVNIIASGGVSTMKDLENIEQTGASGVIIGKALYQGALHLADVIRIYESSK